MRRIASALNLVVLLGACSTDDPSAADTVGSGGAGGAHTEAGAAGMTTGGAHCGYGGSTAGTSAGGAGDSEGPDGGTGGECPVDAGSGGADSGSPSAEQLSYEAFQACEVTPVISASMTSDDNNRESFFEVPQVRALLEALRDRIHAKYVVTQTETFGEFTTWTHLFVITPDGVVSRASKLENEQYNGPIEYAYATARCRLLERSAYQACLDSLQSGPWPNCAFDLLIGCEDQPVMCE